MTRDPLWRALALLDVRWRRATLAVLAGVAAVGSAVGLTAVSAWLIARASQLPPVLDLQIAVVAVRALGISRGVFRYLERLASHDVALSGMVRLREEVYRRLAEGRAGAVAALPRGDLLARIGADVDAVGDAVVRALLPAGVAALLGLGTVALIAALLPSAAIALAGCLLVAGVLAPALAARGARRSELGSATARADIASAALTAVEGAGELAIDGRLARAQRDLRDAEGVLRRSVEHRARASALATAVGTAALGSAVLAAILLGIPATRSGALSPVALAVVVLTPLAAFEATGLLPAAALQLLRSRAAARRITDLLDAAAAEVASAAPRRAPSAGPRARQASHPAPHDPGPATDSAGPTLRVRATACGWPGERPVLQGIDLELTRGRAIAVVGPSGVGKTTLLLTLAGVLPARSGEVSLDGIPVTTLADGELARAVALTTEDAHIFSTTLLENLRVARGDVSAAEARTALESAGLSDWVARLEHGLDTLLGPDGATVSGGERRRLLLARALLSPAPLLVLDEPAEHLDPPLADALVTDLFQAARRGDRGVLLATHRLSALAAADEVIVLGRDHDLGPARVLARGDHGSLLTTDPAYRWAVDREHEESA